MRTITPEYREEVMALSVDELEGRLGLRADELMRERPAILNALANWFPLEILALKDTLGAPDWMSISAKLSVDVSGGLAAILGGYDVAALATMPSDFRVDFSFALIGLDYWEFRALPETWQAEIRDGIRAGRNPLDVWLAVTGRELARMDSN